jgi:hypothetical protein
LLTFFGNCERFKTSKGTTPGEKTKNRNPKKVKKISKNKELLEHGYVAYACSRGGQYALHAICQPSPQSFRGVFKTKKAAIEFALKLPRNA